MQHEKHKEELDESLMFDTLCLTVSGPRPSLSSDRVLVCGYLGFRPCLARHPKLGMFDDESIPG